MSEKELQIKRIISKFFYLVKVTPPLSEKEQFGEEKRKSPDPSKSAEKKSRAPKTDQGTAKKPRAPKTEQSGEKKTRAPKADQSAEKKPRKRTRVLEEIGEDGGNITQGNIAQFMRKRTQLVGFEYGQFKHMQYLAEFIDNGLDAIESFQWREQEKSDPQWAFSLDQDINLENMDFGMGQAKDVQVGLSSDLADAFEFSGGTGGESKHTSKKTEDEDFVPEEEGETATGDNGEEVIEGGSVENGSENGETAAGAAEGSTSPEQTGTDEVDVVEEEVLDKEVRKIMDDLGDFVAPVEGLVDQEPFVLLRIKEVKDASIPMANPGRDDANYTFEIFDNGTGMTPGDLQKFGKYLASSKSQKLKQTRGSQGFGAPSAFSDAQNTTGKPIVVVSKHKDELTAITTEFFTTSKNTKKYTFPPTETDVNFAHGTYVKLYYQNIRYKRGVADHYVEQTTLMNSHISVAFTDPYGENHFYPRRVNRFPEEPKHALAHPTSVNIGDFQDLVRSSENLTITSFLTENFVRLTSPIAKKIVAEAQEALADIKNVFQRDEIFISKVEKEGDPVYILIEEDRVYGKATKPRPIWVLRKFSKEDDPDNYNKYLEFYTADKKYVKDLKTKERQINQLTNQAASAETKKDASKLEKDAKEIEKQLNTTRKDKEVNVVALFKGLTPSFKKFPEITDEKDVKTWTDIANIVLLNRAKPKDMEVEQINQTFVKFVAQKYLAPPTDTAIPVGADILENVLIKEYNLDIPQRINYIEKRVEALQPLDDPTSIRAILNRFFSESKVPERTQAPPQNVLTYPEDYTGKAVEEAIEYVEIMTTLSDDLVIGETREPTSGKGLAFAVEAAFALSPKIKPPKRAQDVLMRYVNRTPKLRDNADCAIWQGVASLNWKNYKIDVFDNGIPKENCRLFVNVSGPFVHLMFKSQSKNALAQDETLLRELKLCLEAIGRKVRAFQNKKLTRDKTQKRSSLLEKHVHPFVQAIFTVANSDGAYAGKITLDDLEEKLFAAIGEKKAKAAEITPEGPAGPSLTEQLQARSDQAKLTKPKIETTQETAEITVISSASSKAAAPTAAVAARSATSPQGGKLTPTAGTAMPKTPMTTGPSAAVKKPGPEKSLLTLKPAGVPGGKPAPAKVAPTARPAQIAPKISAPATSAMRKPSVGSGTISVPSPIKKPVSAPAVAPPKTEAPKPVVKRPGGSLVGKPAVIDERSILASIGSQPMDIRDIITKMGITDMSDARYLQIQLRTLETSDKLTVEIKQGKKFYRKK